MKFGCSGKITRLTVAVVNRFEGTAIPKLQVWRPAGQESTLAETYFKHGSEIPLSMPSDVCYRTRLSDGLFRCTLHRDFQVAVEPMDILGIELPATDVVDFDIEFIRNGPTNYVFNNQLQFSVSLSEANAIVNDLPQISILVTIGE